MFTNQLSKTLIFSKNLINLPIMFYSSKISMYNDIEHGNALFFYYT